MRTNKIVALLPIALVTIVALLSCIRPEQAVDPWVLPQPVKIELERAENDTAKNDEVGWYNYFSPSGFSWVSGDTAGSSGGLLLREGDLVVDDSSKGGLFLYLVSDGPALRVAVTDGGISMAGKVVAVSLEDPSGWKWLQEASEPELTGIRFVSVPGELDTTGLPALERLAAANPGVGLMLGSEETLLTILPLFRPHMLFLPEMDVGSDAKVRTLMADQKQLETLLMTAKDSGSLDFLPSLPGLRRLFISDWDVEQAGPLPAGLTGLKTLVVWGADMTDLSALRTELVGLEELSLIDTALSELTGLAALPNLRTLILTGNDGLTDLSGLDSLKELQWLGLPSKTSQEQFATILRTHPDLKILELVEVDDVTDLAPLRGLQGLEGLVLAGDYKNLEVLRELKSLRFVGIPKELLKEAPEQVAALRQSLPDALVVPVAPFCLGSGWILLLIPAITFFGFVKPRWA